jgi:hypothetical protein
MTFYSINEDYEINKSGYIRNIKTLKQNYMIVENKQLYNRLYNDLILLKDIMLTIFKDHKDVMIKEKELLKDAKEINLKSIKEDIIPIKPIIRIDPPNYTYKQPVERRQNPNGDIYGIYNENDELVYIGKCSTPLHKRFSDHKRACSKIGNYIRNNKCIIKHIEYCSDLKELDAKEWEYIIKHQPLCNVYGIIPKEYRKNNI